MTAPYPNNLKTLAKNAGWTIKGLHLKTGIPQGTLYHWNGGKGVITAEYRELLAGIIGCNPRDLAPLNDVDTGTTVVPASMKVTTLSKDSTENLTMFGE